VHAHGFLFLTEGPKGMKLNTCETRLGLLNLIFLCLRGGNYNKLNMKVYK
jgi:hypothetical protein